MTPAINFPAIASIRGRIVAKARTGKYDDSFKSSLDVYVRITAETDRDGFPLIDQENEVADYAAAKETLVRDWNRDVLLNHKKIRIGECLRLYFDDLRRAVYALFRITDPVAIQAIESGRLNGVSWRGPIPDGGLIPDSAVTADGVRHHFLRLIKWVCKEVSLVFDPVNPYAAILAWKGYGPREPQTDEELAAMAEEAAAVQNTKPDHAAQRMAFLVAACESMKSAIDLGLGDLGPAEIPMMESMITLLRETKWLKEAAIDAQASQAAEAVREAAEQAAKAAAPPSPPSASGATAPSTPAPPESAKGGDGGTAAPPPDAKKEEPDDETMKKLDEGDSDEVIAKNIKTLIAEGKDPDQAAAIAYKKAGRERSKGKPATAPTAHLGSIPDDVLRALTALSPAVEEIKIIGETVKSLAAGSAGLRAEIEGIAKRLEVVEKQPSLVAPPRAGTETVKSLNPGGISAGQTGDFSAEVARRMIEAAPAEKRAELENIAFEGLYDLALSRSRSGR